MGLFGFRYEKFGVVYFVEIDGEQPTRPHEMRQVFLDGVHPAKDTRGDGLSVFHDRYIDHGIRYLEMATEDLHKFHLWGVGGH